MLYKIGTMAQLATLPCQLPEPAYTELVRSVAVLDAEYGEGRDWLTDGGCCVIVETADDLPALKQSIDYDLHPCEWATKQGEYLTALYIISNDYAIMVFMPIAAAPKAILEDLED